MMLVRLALFVTGFTVSIVVGLALDAIRHPIMTALVAISVLSWYSVIH